MVTGDEEIKYGYLLDPCFQMVNTAGKPLTSGWIEVYIAGTRNKYYCSSDFAGTLHPFKIPLDSLGSNIILADVEKSYDVYVYNKFGNLAMSRYNITPGKGGAGGSISGSGIAEHWIGKNGQNTSVPAGSDTALKLPTSYEYEGSFIDRINENRTAFYLKEGLYLVQAVVNFKQSDQSLTNEISQVDVFTRSDDAPEDMSFNRDMAGPDSSDDSHCLKVSFIRCVKEDDEVSQIVLFKVNTPNAWSECYLQNVQIARLSSGGAGAGGQTYYAGDYISIDEETNTISVTGIDPENYATHDELQSATSAFITSADLPDLSEYATEQWVLDKHYITSADIPDIPDDLVTSAELAQTSGLIEQDIADLTSAISEALSDKMDKSSSADFYPRYDNPEGYLTSVPSEYVTESEMSGYVQDHTSGFITSADLPDVSDMATKTWVTDQHYITSADVPPQIEYSAGDNIDITNHVVSVTDTSQLIPGENVSITPSGTDYIISAQVPATSGYVTEQEMNDAIQSATSAFITSADIPPIPEDVVTSGELATVSGEIVNQIPSLQGYATEEYVTEHTSAFVDSDYVTEYVTSQTSGKQDTLTFEYNSDSAISAINGSAIADTSNVTTEEGQFTVHPNLEGADVTVIYPTDVAPVSGFYDLNDNYDDETSNRTGPYSFYYVFKSPGYDNNTWSANDGDVIQIKVNEAIQGLGSIYGFYSSNNSPAGSNCPTINYPASTALVIGTGASYTLEPGVYTVALGSNPAGSGYGKYICLAVNKAGSGTYVDDILNKIEFTFGRPNSALGATVNLNRYYLGNTVNSYTLNSELACQLNVDSTTKQQKVYLPGSIPNSWTSRIAQYIEYGSNYLRAGGYNTSQQYIAYKQSSNPTRYQYAICTDNDWTNKKMTFLSYNESGQAIEKWTVDYSNYSTNVWTTTSLNGASEQYVQDAIASGTSAFITSADLPDVSDMATQTWVGEQGYLTSVPSEYVTETELESAISGKADTSAIPDVSNFVTQEDVDASVSGKMDATESSAFYPMATNPSGYLTSADVDMSAYIPYSAAGVTLENSNFKIDTNGQAYKGAGITSVDYPVVHDSSSQVSVNDTITLTQYDKIWLYNFQPNTYQNSTFYLTFYEMIGSIETRYDREISVSSNAYDVTIGYNAADPQHSIPTGTFYKITVEQYPATFNFTNIIFNRYRNAPAVKYATVNDLSAAIASGTSGKQDTLTFGYDASDKINAINGSAIAGGGGGGGSYTAGEFIDITNDVISVNSGDVSNLIPGSGILITQSSAGTTVSIDPEELPNSTPYETVLWEGENGELMSADNYSVNLSDDPLNYTRIGVYGRPNENAGCQNYVEFDPSYSAVCKTVTQYMNSSTPVWSINTYTFSGNNMTLVSQTHVAGSSSYAGGLWIYKVVGINKKES